MGPPPSKAADSQEPVTTQKRCGTADIDFVLRRGSVFGRRSGSAKWPLAESRATFVLTQPVKHILCKTRHAMQLTGPRDGL